MKLAKKIAFLSTVLVSFAAPARAVEVEAVDDPVRVEIEIDDKVGYETTEHRIPAGFVPVVQSIGIEHVATKRRKITNIGCENDPAVADKESCVRYENLETVEAVRIAIAVGRPAPERCNGCIKDVYFIYKDTPLDVFSQRPKYDGGVSFEEHIIRESQEAVRVRREQKSPDLISYMKDNQSLASGAIQMIPLNRKEGKPYTLVVVLLL